MSQAPIKSPVRPGAYTHVDLLRDTNPAAYQALLNIKHDSPNNFRDGHERKKKPYIPDIFRRHP